ncbi:MAG: SPOR domain-containing protein [Nitritalea sp.]
MQEEQEKREKDFGFPFVETVNLYQLNQKREHERIKRKKEAQSSTESMESPAVAASSPPKEKPRKRVSASRKEAKRGPSRVAITAVFLLIFLMFGLWYMLEFGLPMPEKVAVAVEEKLSQEMPSQTEVAGTDLEAGPSLSGASESGEGLDAQQTGEEAEAPEIELSATGRVTSAEVSEAKASAPERVTSAEVMRLDGSNRKGNYYLIVASFPSEAVSLTEAKKYLNQTNNVYLLAPLDAKSNFRIAVASYDTVEEGQRALPEARKTFGQGAWILKY